MEENWAFMPGRVTKYDPQFRDKDRGYTLEDWISVSDIGKYYRGKQFLWDDYIATEDAYVKAALLFLNSRSCKQVILREVENYIDLSRESNLGYGKELAEQFINVKSGQVMDISEVDAVVRAILREVFWGAIEAVDLNARIYFGYDYYMYFKPASAVDELEDQIKGLGLFVG
jgi:hypothetical protein